MNSPIGNSALPDDLKEYLGEVVLVVNIASRCGFTPQLKGLQELHEQYGSRGLKILAYPSDDFNQEPLDLEGVKQFCEINFHSGYRIMEKCHVKGPHQHPVFAWLSDRRKNGKSPIRPYWNFHKYLIDKTGKVHDYYLPITKPESWRVKRAIEKLLHH
ncbi:MAG: glutathione peroxidase [Bacteroidota bacterium]|nr:glutathione peroxidase [Bacteroidota bacterium]MDX5431396.1 glutathione peroxidase [Bacteroidota bacterium]MDX5470124.1 glutathione peroxidase [Bacteroidota bacterium]